MRIITHISLIIGEMKVFIEHGDEPDLIALVYNLRKCGVRLEIISDVRNIPHISFRDEDVRGAIIKVVSRFSVSTQWCAVYRILVDYCDYPEEITSFCRKINKLMKGVKLSYPCKYQSIQKTMAARAIFQKRYNNWTEVNPQQNDLAFRRQLIIAALLLESLGIG